jgi:hypothetical protein
MQASMALLCNACFKACKAVSLKGQKTVSGWGQN